jgi:hypothetical protein
MSDTIWKNGSLHSRKTDGTIIAESNENINYDALSPSFLPDALSSKPSSSQKGLKKKMENPKRITLFEDLYDPFMLDSTEYEGASLLGNVLQEGLLTKKQIDASDAITIKHGAKSSSDIKKMKTNAGKNLKLMDEDQSKLKELKEKTKERIKNLKTDILKADKAAADFSKEINADPPVVSPADFTHQAKVGAATFKDGVKKSMNRLSYVIKLIISKIKNIKTKRLTIKLNLAIPHKIVP